MGSVSLMVLVVDELNPYQKVQPLSLHLGSVALSSEFGDSPTSGDMLILRAAKVISKVSEGFIVFFVLYVTIVVFAVIRVIGAVFLKDTLDAAQNDAEQLVMDKIALKEKYVEKLAFWQGR